MYGGNGRLSEGRDPVVQVNTQALRRSAWGGGSARVARKCRVTRWRQRVHVGGGASAGLQPWTCVRGSEGQGWLALGSCGRLCACPEEMLSLQEGERAVRVRE